MHLIFLLYVARGRNCETSVTEPSTDTIIGTESGNSDTNTDDDSHHSTTESDDDNNLFSRSKDDTTSPNLNNNKLWTSNIICKKTSKDFENNQHHIPRIAEYPNFSSSFARHWRNQSPPLPRKYSHSIEMPSSEIQLHLIDLFFETKYKIAPIIPKKLFYEQLRTKGPIITPFLLNSIYCLVSAHATIPDVPKPNVFYNRAKKLLDDFLDTPRVSTVAALCLLALYEPLPTESKSMSNQHCRSWIYGGMAFRMCLGLGLNLDTTHAPANSSIEDIQLCRRVFWSCYCLDKMQSARCESSWSIPSSLIKTTFPQVLPGDDENEKQIILAFEQRILLALICEEGLQIRASFAIRGEIFDSKFYDQLEQYKLKIFSWRNNLKSPGLWGFNFCQTIEQVLNQPKFSPIVSYVHVIYYYMLTELFFCLPEGHEKSLEQRIYAAQLTRSISNACKDPAVVIHYEFLAHAAIGAIRVHSYYLNDSDPDISRQSHYLFKQSIQILQTFQKYAVIPEISAVLTHLPVIYQQSNPDPDISSSSPSSQNDNTCIDSPQIFSDLNYKGDHDVCTTQPLQQFQQLPLAQFEQISIDSYGNNIMPCLQYQNRDTLSVSSSRQSLHEVGYSLSVDFSDPIKQLWDSTFQGVSNDIGSAVSTPDETGVPQTVCSFSSHSDWNSSMPTDVTYCAQNDQHLHSSGSPPPAIHMQQQQQNYNIPHLPQHDINSFLCGQFSDRNHHVPIPPLLQTYSNLSNFNFDDGLHDQTYYSD